MEKIQTPDWTQVLDKFRASRLSVRKFAGTHGINYHALIYHIRKEREQNSRHSKKKTEFVQLPVIQQSSGSLKPGVTVQVEERSVTIKVDFGS